MMETSRDTSDRIEQARRRGQAGVILAWVLALLGAGWMLVVLVGSARTSDPQWALRLFQSIGPAAGVTAFAAYLLISLILPAITMVMFIRLAGPWIRRGWAIGLLAGLGLGFFLDFLQCALPFVGDQLNVPGLPLALEVFDDARLAVIWGFSFAVNMAVYGFVGLVAGTVLGSVHRRSQRKASTRTQDSRAPRHPCMWLQGGLCAVLTVVAFVVAGWPFGAGVAACDALLAVFDAAPGLRYHRDVTYASPGDAILKLDICLPAQPGAALPAVVCIHGGGWHGGTREQYTPLIVALARRGYVAATISYRFIPAHRFPAQIEDAQNAVRWLRANADRYAINPKRIGVIGWSAGGHLACLLGTIDKEMKSTGQSGIVSASSRVQAVVAFSPLTDLTADYWDTIPSGIRKLIGARIAENPEAYRTASATTHVDAGDPPFLLLHGEADEAVPLDQSRRISAALTEVGVPAVVRTFPDGGHRWYGPNLQEANKAAFDFLDRYLRNSGTRERRE
jgi:acetyl esterase/lipase